MNTEDTQRAADEQHDHYPVTEQCPQWIRSADRALEFATEYSITSSLMDITKKIQLAEHNNIPPQQVHLALKTTISDAMEARWDDESILYLVTAARILGIENKEYDKCCNEWNALARILGKCNGIEVFIQYQHQQFKYNN